MRPLMVPIAIRDIVEDKNESDVYEQRNLLFLKFESLIFANLIFGLFSD